MNDTPDHTGDNVAGDKIHGSITGEVKESKATAIATVRVNEE
jgi:hypothetical protein